MKTISIFLFLSLNISQATAQVGETINLPYLDKAASVNMVKVVDSLSNQRDKTYVAQEVNRLLNSWTQKGDAQIIFQSVAYTSQGADLSDKVIAALKSGSAVNPAQLFESKVPPLLMAINGEKVLSVSNPAKEMIAKLQNEFSGRQDALRIEALSVKNDAEKLLRDKAFLETAEGKSMETALGNRSKELQVKINAFKRDLDKRTYQERAGLALKINPYIERLSQKLGIQIVAQDVVYVHPSYDLTDELIALLNQEKSVDQILLNPGAKVPMRIAYVNTEKIFGTFANKDASLSQEENFKQRSGLAQKANLIVRNMAEKGGVALVAQTPSMANDSLDITSNVIALMGATTTQLKGSQGDGSLEDAKAKCADLGFKVGTEQFGKCVLRISK